MCEIGLQQKQIYFNLAKLILQKQFKMVVNQTEWSKLYWKIRQKSFPEWNVRKFYRLDPKSFYNGEPRTNRGLYTADKKMLGPVGISLLGCLRRQAIHSNLSKTYSLEGRPPSDQVVNFWSLCRPDAWWNVNCFLAKCTFFIQ